MDAVTYPNGKVVAFLQNMVVPLQISSNAEPHATDYQVKWTPSLLIIDSEGKEHHRITGFLPPVDFIAWLMLGTGKAYFNRDQLKEAIECFDRLLLEYGYTNSAPEAVFLRGVAQYKSTHEPEHLKKAYQKLNEEYHGSEWTKRAYPYWLLP